MARTAAPAKTPTVAIARILRGLGLTQGRGGKDFRVCGEYRNGERQYTYVVVYSRHAEEVIAEHADEIEARADEAGFPFRVSVRYSTAGHPHTSVQNAGSRVRETPPVEPAAALATARRLVDVDDDPISDLTDRGYAAAEFREAQHPGSAGKGLFTTPQLIAEARDLVAAAR
jgi:hypothetical protein